LSNIKVDPLAQPQIHSSVTADATVNSNSATPTKPTGAYRPPHARGTAIPVAFKREDEGGVPYTNGLTAPKVRVVPGLGPVENKEDKKTRNRKKKEKTEKPPSKEIAEVVDPVSVPEPPATPPVPESSSLSADDGKRQRALLKKLRAIEELRLRQASGEKLEKTQLQKMEKETEILHELKKLGGKE
jgi:translation initiation factor 2A